MALNQTAEEAEQGENHVKQFRKNGFGFFPDFRK